MNWKTDKVVTMVVEGATAVLAVGLIVGSVVGDDFWFSADQRAQRLFERGDYTAAAEAAEDPVLSGAAWFEAGEFGKAAAAFSRSGRPEAWYGLGNCRVLLGQYQAAVEAYDAGLDQRPDWTEARENRELASIRAERTKRQGGEMGQQEIGADEIVFSKGRKNPDEGRETVVDGGGKIDDKQLQAMWLRRLDTRPADFLKSKFAWQAAQQEDSP